MCFSHIINTCCQHVNVIASLTDIDLTKAAEVVVGVLPPDLSGWQTFEDAVKRDPMALGCNIHL
jgi:hypothetical protein